jgi:flagellar biosynthesis/type III secretory pathway chaperone
MIEKLITILGREAEVFESFLTLLEKQKKMLVSNDTDGLNQVTDRQREKVVESQLLAKERERLIEEIRVANRLDGDLNVTRLLEIIETDQADRLSALRDMIIELSQKIEEVRNTNALLLNRSRQYIQKTLEMLARMNNPQPEVYSSAGKTGQSEQTLALDRRI